jgi:hypothetical protein
VTIYAKPESEGVMVKIMCPTCGRSSTEIAYHDCLGNVRESLDNALEEVRIRDAQIQSLKARVEELESAIRGHEYKKGHMYAGQGSTMFDAADRQLYSVLKEGE